MKTTIQKSRCPSWLTCLLLAGLLQLTATPQLQAAPQPARTQDQDGSIIRAQYYPYQEPSDTSAPYNYAPSDNSLALAWPYSDSDIRRTVRFLFVTDTFLDAINIRLKVQDGAVLLTGSVKTWENRSRAETDAYAAGAQMVLNQLRVIPF
jgi:hypothetical protein